MAVSTAQVVLLSAGGSTVIAAGPQVITSVMVTELSGEAAASVTLAGNDDPALLLNLAAAAGQSVVWSGEPIAAPNGIVAACYAGDVAVRVAYR